MLKKTEKQKKKKEDRRKNKGTIAVFALCDCGCCTAKMRFRSEKSALEAFKAAGLQNSATITDDQGTVHEGIDTFYGLSLTDTRM